MITCVFYGQEQEFKTRKEAINFCLEAMAGSEGCERDRYTNVYLDLLAGKTYCLDSDEIELDIH